MIRKALEMMARTYGARPVVVLTGGPSVMVRKVMPKAYIIDENLILKGLFIIHSLGKEIKC